MQYALNNVHFISLIMLKGIHSLIYTKLFIIYVNETYFEKFKKSNFGFLLLRENTVLFINNSSFMILFLRKY